MSVGRKFRGLIGAGLSVFSAVCASHVSFAETKTWCDDKVKYRLDGERLLISGVGEVRKASVVGHLTSKEMKEILEINISEGIDEITYSAFAGFRGLKYVRIPNSVTNIGNYAFTRCSSLKNITIPDSVTNIGDYAFCGCKNLKNITIPDSVTNIGDSAFSYCSSLKNITIPDSVTNIGHSAFCDCKALEKFIIPHSVTNIGPSFFRNCESLKNITIPCSVIGIGKSAFCGCKNLRTVKLENCISDENSFWNVMVFPYAFDLCEKLELFDIGNRTVYFDIYAFDRCDKNFRACEKKVINGKFGNSMIFSNDSNYRYNYFIPHGILVDKTKYWYR